MAGIGDFNKRVSIKLNPTKVSNGSGGYTITGYSSTINTWAKVKDTGGERVFDNVGKDKIISKKDFEVLYRSDLADLANGEDIDAVIVYSGKEYLVDKPALVNEIKRIIRIEAVSED